MYHQTRKNLKIVFSFDSALCASFIEMGAKTEGEGRSAYPYLGQGRGLWKEGRRQYRGRWMYVIYIYKYAHSFSGEDLQSDALYWYYLINTFFIIHFSKIRMQCIGICNVKISNPHRSMWMLRYSIHITKYYKNTRWKIFWETHSKKSTGRHNHRHYFFLQFFLKENKIKIHIFLQFSLKVQRMLYSNFCNPGMWEQSDKYFVISS